MLVLSRKARESIDIGSDIRIKVVAVKGNRVKLGIEAPDSIHVVRTELLSVEFERDDSEPSSVAQ